MSSTFQLGYIADVHYTILKKGNSGVRLRVVYIKVSILCAIIFFLQNTLEG